MALHPPYWEVKIALCRLSPSKTRGTDVQVCFLRSMPNSPVFHKLLCRPYQSNDIADAAADHDARGAIIPSKNKSAQRDYQRAHKRIDEEYLLFMRSQIISFCEDNDICDHVKHQHCDGTRVEQPLSESNVLPIKVEAPKPCR